MSVFRRSLLLRSLLQEDDYIRKGLVFHLDGINKGKNEGKWTDLISKVQFTPDGEVTFYPDFVRGELNTEHPLPWDAETSTIEICGEYIDYPYGERWFMSNTPLGISCGTWASMPFKGFYFSTKAAASYYYDLNNGFPKKGILRLSANAKAIVFNTKPQIVSSNNNWKYFIGSSVNVGDDVTKNKKIYSIRIYNRHLTEEEMLHNQEVDYKRFLENIEKTIYVKSTSDKIDIKINNRVDIYNVLPNVFQKIVIKESITSFRQIINNSKATELDLSNFDTSAITDFYQAFYYNYILKDIILGAAKPINMGLTFSHCVNLKSIDISKWDLSDVTNTDRTFLYNKSLTNLKFGKNLKKSIDLSYASLTHESALSVINGLAEVDTPQNLTFSESTYLTLSEEEIALVTNKGWNVVVPTSLQNKILRVVSNSNSITFKVNNIEKTYNTTPNKWSRLLIDEVVTKLSFEDNAELVKIDTSDLDCSGITNQNRCFIRCINLVEAYLPHFADNSYDLAACFYGCGSLTTVDISGYLNKPTGFLNTFWGCDKLVNVTFPSNIIANINLNWAYDLSDSSITSLIEGLAEIDTSRNLEISTITYLKLSNNQIALITSKGWNVVIPNSFAGKVVKVISDSDTINIRINDVSKEYDITPDVLSRIVINESITTLVNMCKSNTNLLTLDLSNLDMTKVTDIGYFVNSCTNLESVILSEATNITWLYNAFGSCRNLKSIDMSKVDLGKVTQSSAFSYIFYGCTSLKDLKFGYNLKFSVDFKSCPLSYESALSVINGLAEVTTTQTITFSGITSAYLSAEDVALATAKGWTVVDADNGNIWGGIGTKPGTGDEWD